MKELCYEESELLFLVEAVLPVSQALTCHVSIKMYLALFIIFI